MHRYVVFIVGNGKLARELLENLSGENISEVVQWKDRSSLQPERGVVVHAGSGRELPEVIDYCTGTGSILFELSTTGTPIPDTVCFPVVICPNVNILMLQFMAMIRQAAPLFRGYKIEIAESHQSSKKSKPGTAIYLAKTLGIPESDIRSERDPAVQNAEMGIPRQHLDRHAYHRIVISNQDTELKFETKVLGKTAYAASLSFIIDNISGMKLPAGHYDIVELFLSGHYGNR
jgi:4-hydroxy-tetrahydrodipicolinate reductase